MILVILARLTDQETVGRYSLALAITAPIFVFSQLGLKGVFLTHRTENIFSRYFTIQISALILAILASFVVTWVADPTLLPVVLLVGLVKVGDTISDLFAAPLQAFGSTAWVFWGFLAGALFGAIAAASCLVVTGSLELTLLALALASMLGSGVFMWIPAFLLVTKHSQNPVEQIGPLRAENHYIAIIKAGLPSGAGGAILALVASVPQYFLAASWGSSAVAQYAVTYYIIMVADIFLGTVAQGWILRARKALASLEIAPKGFFRFTLSTALVWTAIMVPVSIFGTLLAALLIPLIFGAEYQIAPAIMLPVVLAVLVLPILSFSNMAIIVRNLYIHTITVSAISAAASILFGWLLIPPFGVVGSFWTFVLAAAVRALPGLLLIRRDEKLDSLVKEDR